MKWNFPSNNHGDVIGVSDAGTETFKGTPNGSLAREICQNSLDAHKSDDKVFVEFESIDCLIDRIPDIETIRNALKLGAGYWSTQSEKAKNFFTNAMEVVCSSTISVLRISDYGTTGLTRAECLKDSAWFNLTKGIGAANKTGSAGGAFGVGKYAPYACSCIRTVFYSTFDVNGQKAHQGIARLPSYPINDEEFTAGTGYYGEENNKPVIGSEANFYGGYNRRDRSGTDIYVIGFHETENWERDIITSILDGFLYALFMEKLVVRVNSVIIDKGHLEELCNKYSEFLEQHADDYYRVLSSIEPVKISNFKGMGDIYLYLKIFPGQISVNRKVAMVRKTGIKIFDRANISGHIPFSGVMYFDGEKINEYLRSLENPQHTKWECERVDDSKGAKEILRDIGKTIKEELKKLCPETLEEQFDPNVGNYLPEQDISKDYEHIDEGVGGGGILDISQHEMKPPRDITQQEAIDNNDDAININNGGNEIIQGSSGSNDAEGGDTVGIGENPGGCDGDIDTKAGKGYRKLDCCTVRLICIDRSRGRYRFKIVSSQDMQNCKIEFNLIAETSRYPLELLSVTSSDLDGEIQINKNCVEGITLKKNEPVNLDTEISYSDYCSMEVMVYGN